MHWILRQPNIYFKFDDFSPWNTLNQILQQPNGSGDEKTPDLDFADEFASLLGNTL